MSSNHFASGGSYLLWLKKKKATSVRCNETLHRSGGWISHPRMGSALRWESGKWWTSFRPLVFADWGWPKGTVYSNCSATAEHETQFTQLAEGWKLKTFFLLVKSGGKPCLKMARLLCLKLRWESTLRPLCHHPLLGNISTSLLVFSFSPPWLGSMVCLDHQVKQTQVWATQVHLYLDFLNN